MLASMDDICDQFDGMDTTNDITELCGKIKKLNIKKRIYFDVVLIGVDELCRKLCSFSSKLKASIYIYYEAEISLYDLDDIICDCPRVRNCNNNKKMFLRCIMRNNGWNDFKIIKRTE